MSERQEELKERIRQARQTKKEMDGLDEIVREFVRDTGEKEVMGFLLASALADVCKALAMLTGGVEFRDRELVNDLNRHADLLSATAGALWGEEIISKIDEYVNEIDEVWDELERILEEANGLDNDGPVG